MYKEFLEIVGNGSPTGSVPEETIAIPATISMRVEKQHSRILLRYLLRGTMREKRREPEVPEEEAPVVASFAGFARITSKELASTRSVKSGTPECLFYKTKSGCEFGEKCSYAHRQVDEQPGKRSKKNGDESAVAMLKKMARNVWQLVVNLDKSHERSGRPDKNRDHLACEDLLDVDHLMRDN